MSIRCLKCGFINPDNAKKCLKCGADLKSAILDKNLNSSKETENNPKVNVDSIEVKTIFDFVCPVCGSPIPPNAKKCPNCATILQIRQDEDKDDISKQNFSSKQMANSTLKPRNFVPAKEQQITLVFEELAMFELKPLNNIKKFTIEEKLVLNRDNIAPNSNTISRKAHAIIEKREDGFYLIDKSTFKTTFVYVNKPYKLKDGDIIVLGDKMFKIKFEIK